jgi:hypothetical protein
LVESTKIEADAGELAAQVIKDITCLEILLSEKRIREKLFKGLLKLEDAERDLHDRVFRNHSPVSILREDYRRCDKLRTSIGFIFSNLCQSYQRSEVNTCMFSFFT